MLISQTFSPMHPQLQIIHIFICFSLYHAETKGILWEEEEHLWNFFLFALQFISFILSANYQRYFSGFNQQKNWSQLATYLHIEISFEYILPLVVIYVTRTRIGVSGMGMGPRVQYRNPKKLGHMDSVQYLDTGTGTRKLLVIKFLKSYLVLN